MNSEITSLVDQSVKLESRGDFAESARLAADALSRARQHSEDLDALCLALSQHALLCMRLGEPEAASAAAKEVISLSPESRPAVLAHLTMANIELQAMAIDRTEYHIHRAVSLSRKLRDLGSLARSLQNLVSSVYLVRGQFNLAMVVLEESATIKQDLDLYAWGFPAISAMIHLITGNRQKARQYIQELEELVDPGARSAAMHAYLIASLALDEEQLELAVNYLQKAYRIAVRSGAPEINIWVRCEYSRYHRLRDEPGAALPWANDAIQYAEASRFHLMHVQSLIEKAQVLFQLEDIEGALASLEAAEQIGVKTECHFELTRIHLLRSIYLFDLDKPAARENWLRAYQEIKRGEYWFLIEKKRKAVFPLLKIYLDSQDKELHNSADDLIRRLATISPVPLRIYGLGQFRVHLGNRLISDTALQKRKSGELLMFLLLQPNLRASKEVVVDQFWPDAHLESGIQLLHQATSSLRRVLEPDIPDRFPSHYIWYEGDQVCLRLPPGSFVDFLEFSTSIRKAIESENPLILEKALGLYNGPLFPNARYDDWVIADRNHLVELFLNGAETLGKVYLEQKEYRSALDISLRMLQIDPCCEPAAMIAMSAYIHLQDAPRALRVFREIERQLAQEMDLLPRNDLRELANSLRLTR